MGTATPNGPFWARPTNAAVDVPTPWIGFNPDGISSMYTSGDRYSAILPLLVVGAGLGYFALEICLNRKTTNSAGLDGATPISVMTWPTATVAGVLVVSSQRTKNALSSVVPTSLPSS